MCARRGRITSKSADLHPVADLRECFQQPDAMVELDGRPAKVVLVEQVVQADANLQDALVQVAYLAGRGSPQQFQRFVLLEKLAGVEFMDGLKKLRRRWRGAGCDQVSCGQALEGAHQFWVDRARFGRQRKGYTAP